MKIETKILFGIGSIVGIMLLVGWIIINEPARMEVFTQQWQGRSIERGAALYLNNCTSCHGADSLGANGVAPALKNPYLFLTENPAKVADTKVKDLKKEVKALTDSQAAYTDALPKIDPLKKQLETLKPESAEYVSTKASLDALDAIVRVYDPETPAKITAKSAEVTVAEADLEKVKAEGWDPARDTRLKEMGWGGSLRDYIKSTLISGRPASKFYWPGAMPNWAQSSGGPLRGDEIDNLVDYILAYRGSVIASDGAVKVLPKDLNQQFKLPIVGEVSTEPRIVDDPGLPLDVKTVTWTGGDAVKGKALYEGKGCAGCHSAEGGAAYAVAPTAGTYTRVVDIRLKVDKYAGWTPEQYLAEAILVPAEYLVPGAAAGLMPQNFSEQFSINELKDVIAYISTYK